MHFSLSNAGTLDAFNNKFKPYVSMFKLSIWLCRVKFYALIWHAATDIQRKVDCSSFVMCLLQALPLPRVFLLQPVTVVTRQTKQAVCAIKQNIFLDVYACSGFFCSSLRHNYILHCGQALQAGTSGRHYRLALQAGTTGRHYRQALQANELSS